MPYDSSGSAEHALDRAVGLAARQPNHILHVVAAIARGGGAHDQQGYDSAADLARAAIAERVADAFVEHAGELPGEQPAFRVHARIGRAAEEILGLARDVGADLIFIGSHGRVGVQRLLRGSVSERVVREARCPVMVVRATTYDDVDLVKIVAFEHERTQTRRRAVTATPTAV